MLTSFVIGAFFSTLLGQVQALPLVDPEVRAWIDQPVTDDERMEIIVAFRDDLGFAAEVAPEVLFTRAVGADRLVTEAPSEV